MKKPKVIKIFGHYQLINENGEILWSEENMDKHDINNRTNMIFNIVNSLKNDEPNYVFKICPSCKGKGYTYGNGINSIDPDWCEECSGLGEVIDEFETQSIKVNIVNKVLNEHGY
jgi:hypothetical protein